ncbi:MAG: CHAP domain-containing protein [Ruminococcaceae bacterium]|nr:CHAP domain-containing protein [Oscillospiraceae bacterium]
MKRLFAAGLLALLLFSGSARRAAALTPTYTVSGTYRSSTYHKNLLALTKTGDPAFDTVAAALSQYTYHEGNSTADFGGNNTSGSKNYTEYNRALGTIGGSYSYAWCAAFASWCLDMAGAKESAGGSFASCTLWVDRLRELGLYSNRSSGYTPKTGDLIFFRSAGTARASDHVGIVRFVKEGRVFTVEGNSSNRVSLRDYALSDTYIVGYGKPRYEGERLSATLLSMEDKTPGLYMVTNSFLNVRAKPSSAAAKAGTLYEGALVRVDQIEEGWGRISYGGKNAYISLDYADLATPLIYTVSYTVEGESVSTQTYFSFESAKAVQAPVREGYRFSGWTDGEGRLFAAGDPLPLGDLQLTAVLETLPEEEPQSPPSAEDGIGDLNAPPVSEEGNTAPLPSPSLPEVADRAAREAGSVTGVLAAVLGLWWYIRKRLG